MIKVLRIQSQRVFPLLILIVILCFSIAIVGWKLFLSPKTATAEDYQRLAEISPQVIIHYQKTTPEAWKDYTAIQAAFRVINQNNQTDQERLKMAERLFQQLDKQVSFTGLNWSQINPQIKKAALEYRRLLDKYSIYSPEIYRFPLGQTCYYIDTFGADREGGQRLHQGTDLFDSKGTPIYNVCAGTVEKLGWNRLGGERVGVRGKDGNYYYYAHLHQINPQLSIGSEIRLGDLIGTMGNTGDAISTPDHLHFGIELANGDWLNPYPFLVVWDFQAGQAGS